MHKFPSLEQTAQREVLEALPLEGAYSRVRNAFRASRRGITAHLAFSGRVHREYSESY